MGTIMDATAELIGGVTTGALGVTTLYYRYQGNWSNRLLARIDQLEKKLEIAQEALVTSARFEEQLASKTRSEDHLRQELSACSDECKRLREIIDGKSRTAET